MGRAALHRAPGDVAEYDHAGIQIYAARNGSDHRVPVLDRLAIVLLCILFFARRDDFLSGRLIEERDTGTVHREDSGDR